jgi:CRISPR-associated exonuclease Cas4
MEQYSLPVSMIRQHLFCPRIPFFYEVIGLRPISPTWTTQGAKYHLKQILLTKGRTLKRFELDQGLFHFETILQSNNLGIHGKCDAIIETFETVVPVEFKMTDNYHKGHALQLCAYSFAAEEKFKKKSKIGFILYGEKARPHIVEFNAILIDECYKVIEEINRNLEKGILPHSCASELQCGQCEFLNYCNDRF